MRSSNSWYLLLTGINRRSGNWTTSSGSISSLSIQGEGNCGVSTVDGLQAANCTEKLPFICEKRKFYLCTVEFVLFVTAAYSSLFRGPVNFSYILHGFYSGLFVTGLSVTQA